MKLPKALFRLLSLIFLGVWVPAAIAQGAGELRTYPVPAGIMYRAHNDDFTVRARMPGGAWQDLYEYRVPVDTDTASAASMVYFDFAGVVELEIQKNNGTFEGAAISPRSSTLMPERNGTRLRLRLTKPERFSIQFDDDRLRNLHIIAGALPSSRPTGSNVRYFGPGVHKPESGDSFAVKSGDRIYLDGGAVLLGAFDLIGVEDVQISGRGLLYDPGRAIELEGARNVDIRDLILVNGPRAEAARVMNVRNSEHVSISEISGFTSGKWSDGINISTSRHVAIDASYLRVSDDAVVVYAVADCPICRRRAQEAGIPDPMPPGDTYDIKVTNVRIWNDVAHALYIGHFGDLEQPRTIRDVTFDNIDIANLDEDDPDWEGAIAMFSGDRVEIRNITFSNIRVDRIEEGKLINIVAGNNARYNKGPGRGIDGVTLRNISFTGEGMPSRSIIRGLSPETAIRNIRIENLSLGGRRIKSADEADIDVGQFVEQLTIQ